MTIPTAEQLDQASEAVAVMLVELGMMGVNPEHLMTPDAWEGLRAVVYAGASIRTSRVAGVRDDDFANMAAGNN